jgi:HSP20 family protein
MIDRYHFWTRPLHLRHMMDRLVQDALTMPARQQAASESTTALDVYEEDNNLVLKVQMPGIKPEDIEVSVQQGVLTVRGQTQAETERKDRAYVVREQRSGSFARSLRLPDNIDVDAAEATFKHGVLSLTFPKGPLPTAHSVPLSGAQHEALDASNPDTEPGTTTSHPVVTTDSPPQRNGTATDDAPTSGRSARRTTTKGKSTGRVASGRKRTARAAAGA